jgi:hypothetical protein
MFARSSQSLWREVRSHKARRSIAGTVHGFFTPAALSNDSQENDGTGGPGSPSIWERPTRGGLAPMATRLNGDATREIIIAPQINGPGRVFGSTTSAPSTPPIPRPTRSVLEPCGCANPRATLGAGFAVLESPPPADQSCRRTDQTARWPVSARCPLSPRRRPEFHRAQTLDHE